MDFRPLACEFTGLEAYAIVDYNLVMRHFITISSVAILIGALLSAVMAQEESKESVQEESSAVPIPEESPVSNKPVIKKIRKVIRVAKPKFDDSENAIYFKDIFKEGLVGERPSPKETLSASNDSKSAGKAGSSGDGTGWSSLIDGTTIEDEVKSLNQTLARTVTTPVKFKTAYNEVRQTMALLSMSFAIIREYDGEVRWKDHAAAAQAALQKAATNARSNADQAFNYCNARKFDLEDLVRGGSFAEIEKPNDEMEWGDVIGRTETMKRLETSDQLLKQWTADEKTFAKQKSRIISESQWVAAIGMVIAKESMDDADVEEYVELCIAMKDAAVQTANAARNDDFEAASKFANLVSQSCNNCHEEWR